MHHSLVKLGQKIVASLPPLPWKLLLLAAAVNAVFSLEVVSWGRSYWVNQFCFCLPLQTSIRTKFSLSKSTDIDNWFQFSYVIKIIHLQSKSLKHCMFWHSSRIVNRIYFDPILCSRTESSHMEDRLVGADIHHHFSITRIEHLKKGKKSNAKIATIVWYSKWYQKNPAN